MVGRGDRSGDRNTIRLLAELKKASVIGPQEARIHLDCMSNAKQECSIIDRSCVMEGLITVVNVSFMCQLDGQRSCAGCCDNFQQDREVLRRKYSCRRAAFDAMVRGRGDLPLYREHMARQELADVSCRFLAFLDDNQQSVGCLLHPKGPTNKGVDLRRYGKHGEPRCQAYICAGLRTVRKGGLYEWLLLHYLQKASNDWYAYSRLFSPSVTYKYYGGLFEIYSKLGKYL